MELTYFNDIGKSGNREVPNIDDLRKHLLREGHINKKELLELISEASKIMRKLSNLENITKIYEFI